MIRRRPTLSDVLFSMLATIATAGALVAFRVWWLAPAVALAALSPFFEWRSVPPRLVRPLPLLLRALLAIALLAVWFTRPMPLLLDEQTRWMPPVLAGLLGALVVAFLVGRTCFRPGGTVVPALLGLMMVTGADPAPGGFDSSALAVFRAAGHNGFADLYVILAALASVLLWIAVLQGSGLQPAAHAGRSLLPIAAASVLCAAGILGLPAAQPRVEQAMADAMNRATTGLSSGATLGEFGELALSRRRVLDLRASEASGAWRLRAEVLTQFDGRRWRAGRRATRPAPLRARDEPVVEDPLLANIGPWFAPAEAGPADGVRLRITQGAVDSWPLLLPQHVAVISAATPRLEQDALGFVRRTGGSAVGLYGAALTTRPPRTTLGAEDGAAALELPPGLDPRIRALALSLAPDGASESVRLAHTVRHMQTQYRYTLSPGPFRAKGDPVAEFLFEKKQGYCEYFATAAVLLLRTQGLPARFVKGLSVGPHNHHGGDLFVVRESDAHAWVEAYLPGEGWVEADPTPAADFAAAHAPPGRWSQLVESVRAVLAEAWARVTGVGLDRLLRWALTAARAAASGLAHRPWLVSFALATLALAGLGRPLLRRWRAWRRRTVPPGQGVAPELARAIDELERRWREAGQPRPRGRGLREHARARASAGTMSGAADPDLDLVDRYYAARFGRTRRAAPAAPEESRTASRAAS